MFVVFFFFFFSAADRLAEVTVTQYCQRSASLSAGELHRHIDGHKGRVAASMARAGVGALDATFVPRKHAIAAILIYRRTEITYKLLSPSPRPHRASP